uniref:Glycosyl transferase family 1 domain-containing protein n=1 Tax=viral metagenome TaxID=1070528 RepID=A0A6C0CZB9_9ZZZZ
MNTNNTKIRLHLLAIPHTITRDEFSNCAFTGKVQRFSPMMQSVGYEVYHYGIETSKSGADVDIDILNLKEWNKLRKSSLKHLKPELSYEDIEKKLGDPTQFVGDLANLSTPLYKEFNIRLREQLSKHYRSISTDIVCITFGPAHEDALKGKDYLCVESGIGYPNAYKNFRIYESYAKMHYEMHRCGKTLENYWFVCPNYYNTLEWPLNLNPVPNRVGFLGRISNTKGCNIISEIAKSFPQVEFVICGQGDPKPFLKYPNVIYKSPIHGSDRGKYLSSLSAVITPSKYLEPFCGVNVEAQLCGTPVICHDYGAFTETVEQFKTGVRCHTMSDFRYAVQMVLDGKFDRQYIHDRAVHLYDMYNVAKQYKYIFDSIIDVYNGSGGWYSFNTHLDLLENE